MPPVIELDDLEVRFGDRLILKKLNGSLTGRSIGLLGPNGAGKSTLINTLLGFHQPSAGTARIFGRDIRTQRQERAQPDRLHAGKRFLHRRHERRALRPPDGGTGRPARRASPGARARSVLLRRPGRSRATARWALTRWA